MYLVQILVLQENQTVINLYRFTAIRTHFTAFVQDILPKWNKLPDYMVKSIPVHQLLIVF